MNGNAISSAALSREEYGESDAPSSQPSLLQRQLSTAESEQEGAAAPRRRRRRYPAVRINLEHCKYEVLRLAAKDLGWRRVEAYGEDWDVCWMDTSVGLDRIMKLQTHQRINHFSGMLEICRKNSMARNLMRMAARAPESYRFFPRTFVLPEDTHDFLQRLSNSSRGKPRPTWILKPDAGCQGRGIRLVQTVDQAKEVLDEYTLSQTVNVVAQKYVGKPYLIHGTKFDLRVYVLVLSADPLRVYVYDEGLVRFCTEPYEAPKGANLSKAFVHLTNSAVNRRNEAYQTAADAQDSSGAKWGFGAFRTHLESEGHSFDVLLRDIGDIAVRALVAVQPLLKSAYWSAVGPQHDAFGCFELLGLDVMLDEGLRPVLLESNHMPSLNTDSPLDMRIKRKLVVDTLRLVNMEPDRIWSLKKAEARASKARLLDRPAKKPSAEQVSQRREAENDRRRQAEESLLSQTGYLRAYPSGDMARDAEVERLMRVAEEIFQETDAARRARDVLARVNLQKAAEQRQPSKRPAPPRPFALPAKPPPPQPADGAPPPAAAPAPRRSPFGVEPGALPCLPLTTEGAQDAGVVPGALQHAASDNDGDGSRGGDVGSTAAAGPHVAAKALWAGPGPSGRAGAIGGEQKEHDKGTRGAGDISDECAHKGVLDGQPASEGGEVHGSQGRASSACGDVSGAAGVGLGGARGGSLPETERRAVVGDKGEPGQLSWGPSPAQSGDEGVRGGDRDGSGGAGARHAGGEQRRVTGQGRVRAGSAGPAVRRRGAAWGGDAGGVGLGDGGGAGQELAVVGGAGVVGVGVGGASSAHEGSRDRDTGSHHTSVAPVGWRPPRVREGHAVHLVHGPIPGPSSGAWKPRLSNEHLIANGATAGGGIGGAAGGVGTSSADVFAHETRGGVEGSSAALTLRHASGAAATGPVAGRRAASQDGPAGPSPRAASILRQLGAVPPSPGSTFQGRRPGVTPNNPATVNTGAPPVAPSQPERPRDTPSAPVAAATRNNTAGAASDAECFASEGSGTQVQRTASIAAASAFSAPPLRASKDSRGSGSEGWRPAVHPAASKAPAAVHAMATVMGAPEGLRARGSAVGPGWSRPVASGPLMQGMGVGAGWTSREPASLRPVKSLDPESGARLRAEVEGVEGASRAGAGEGRGGRRGSQVVRGRAVGQAVLLGVTGVGLSSN